MLVIQPKLNKRITISDEDSGTSWELWFYYLQGGKPAIAFDAPKSIKITNQALTATKKEFENDDNGK